LSSAACQTINWVGASRVARKRQPVAEPPAGQPIGARGDEGTVAGPAIPDGGDAVNRQSGQRWLGKQVRKPGQGAAQGDRDRRWIFSGDALNALEQLRIGGGRLWIAEPGKPLREGEGGDRRSVRKAQTGS
jgi:hypothetical protein